MLVEKISNYDKVGFTLKQLKRETLKSLKKDILR